MFSTKDTSQRGDRKEHTVLQSKICITLLQVGKSFLTRYASSSPRVQSAALHPSWLTKRDLKPRRRPLGQQRGVGDTCPPPRPLQQQCTEKISTEAPLGL